MPRSPLVADVVTYNLKVWAAGMAAAVFVPLSLAALALDLVTGRGGGPGSLARRVLAASARFEAALDLHGDLTDVRVTGTAASG